MPFLLQMTFHLRGERSDFRQPGIIRLTHGDRSFCNKLHTSSYLQIIYTIFHVSCDNVIGPRDWK